MTTGLTATHKQEGKDEGKESRVKFNLAIIFFGSFPFQPALHTVPAG